MAEMMLAWSSVALDTGRTQHDSYVTPTKSDRDDVVDRSTVSARDDTDDTRVRRKRPLARWLEQPLGPKLLFQRLESDEERAAPCRPSKLGDELQAPAGRPDRRATQDLHPRSVGEKAPSAQRLRAIHDAIDACVFALVFEREVEVTARGGLQRRYLTLHPFLAGRPLDGTP